MRRLTLLFLFCVTITTFAQNDDPLAVLDKNTTPSTVYASATFKSTRVVNGQSIETIAKKHLDFRISHHFGPLNDGTYNFFGLDQASMRLGFEYGVTDNLMVGIGRSTMDKTFDYFAKYKLLKQASGAKNIPVSVTLFGSIAATSLKSSTGMVFLDNLERMTYCSQILIARKITDGVSIQISPTYLHRNKVFYYNPQDANELLEPNDIFAVGVGGRFKISKRTSINAEYFYRLPSMNANTPLNSNYHNSLSIGVDIETGGHVFQLHFTNSLGMIEKQFIAQTTDTWSNGGVRWGFNLSRTFSFDKEQKKGAW